jgi:hypothetical protein
MDEMKKFGYISFLSNVFLLVVPTKKSKMDQQTRENVITFGVSCTPHLTPSKFYLVYIAVDCYYLKSFT